MSIISGNGTLSNPYTVFKIDASEWSTYNGKYIKYGCAVEIRENTVGGLDWVCAAIPDNHGLTYDTGAVRGTLTGTEQYETLNFTISEVEPGTGDYSDNYMTLYLVFDTVRITLTSSPSGTGSWYVPGGVATPVTYIDVIKGSTLNVSGNYAYFVHSAGNYQVYFSEISGYTFNSITPSSGTFNSANTLTANTTYTPVYTTYTLNFDANGGTGAPASKSSPSTTASSYTFTIPSTTPTRSGYVFLGWGPNSSSTYPSYYPGGSYPVNRGDNPRTIYAVWGYAVSFTASPAGYGTVSSGSVNAEVGVSYTVSNNTLTINNHSTVTITATAAEGYEFDKWTIGGSTATSGYISSNGMNFTAVFKVGAGTFSLSYSANGGSGAPATQTYTGAGNSHTFTVSGTVPTRSGYTFMAWNTQADGSGSYYDPGDSIEVSSSDANITLYATWVASISKPTYQGVNLPKAAVRIYRSPTCYLDLTYKMTVQPNVYKAVNRGGKFSFTITNDPNNSVLSPGYAGWSDSSTGAVDWGMYCIVDAIQPDGSTEYITDGYVTTMELNDYTLTIQCADHLAILGSRGADIHRNYYDSRTANVIQDVIRQSYISTAPDYILTDITEIISAGGSVDTSTLKYRTGEDDPLYAEGSTRSPIITNKTVYVNSWTKTFSNPFSSMTFKLYTVVGSHRVNVTVDGTPYLSSFTTGSSGNYYLTVDFGTLYEGGEHTITIAGIAPPPGFLTDTMQVYVETSTGTGELVYYDNYGGQRTSSTGNPYVTIKSYNDTNVNAVSTYTSGARTYLKITGIYGKTIQTDYDELTVPITGRVIFSYLSGTVSATEIMNNIASRSGYIPLIHAVQNIPELKLFRSGGGYSLDYLQKIADIDRALTFTAHGYSPTLDIGARRTSANIPAFNVEYGTGEQVDNDLVMYSFKPRKSMTNRPSRALIRTAISDKNTGSTPIIAMVYNDRLLTSRKGIRTDTVVANSSVLSVFDAVRSAYTAVNHDEEDWEGSLTLSGIVPDMIDIEGAYAGSGTVISITDPRYGFFNKSFVITDVTYDFEQITTTVTLTNAPQVYSSAIAESVATAYSAADLVVGDSESTAYNTQYVYARKSGIAVTTIGNTMKIVNSNGEITLGNVTAYVMDGHTLVYGSKTIENSDNPSTAKYDVHAIIVNGVTITIPEEDRPDCYEGQIVIVNVDVTT